MEYGDSWTKTNFFHFLTTFLQVWWTFYASPYIGRAVKALTLLLGRIQTHGNILKNLQWPPHWPVLRQNLEPAVLSLTFVFWPLMTDISIGMLYVLRLCIKQKLLKGTLKCSFRTCHLWPDLDTGMWFEEEWVLCSGKNFLHFYPSFSDCIWSCSFLHFEEFSLKAAICQLRSDSDL